eukprot:15239698-Ditylum_brightwellii.AAC.1
MFNGLRCMVEESTIWSNLNISVVEVQEKRIYNEHLYLSIPIKNGNGVVPMQICTWIGDCTYVDTYVLIVCNNTM